MSELLQEFVDSASERLRVDRDAGIIRGVKLLGLISRNGRRYREAALVDAIALYEGAKVNINHPKGHPLSPRDYRDRLGAMRAVQFRGGEGLFGDLHFNPRHSLSEQLMWDAEHAPQNVGMSHNVLARTKSVGDETVVEAITKVQSIDLVADPATTSGLFEEEGRGFRAESLGPENGSSRLTLNSQPSTLDSLTLEHLRLHRPDLVREIELARAEEVATLQRKLDDKLAEEGIVRRHEVVLEALRQHDLPLPSAGGQLTAHLTSPQFVDMLMQAPTEEAMRTLVEERAALVHFAARMGEGKQVTTHRPKSRDQTSLGVDRGASRCSTAAEFAAAVRG